MLSGVLEGFGGNMIYQWYEDQHRFNGMDVLVLPDDDERLKDLEPGCIGSDGRKFYVPESMWAKLKNQLVALPSNAQVTGRPPAVG